MAHEISVCLLIMELGPIEVIVSFVKRIDRSSIFMDKKKNCVLKTLIIVFQVKYKMQHLDFGSVNIGLNFVFIRFLHSVNDGNRVINI